MIEFRFNFIDIFRAPRLALSAKKIWTQFRALALGLILYNLFAYAAFAVSGADVYRLWSTYYLFPPVAVALAYPLTLAGYLLWAAGTIAFFVVAFLGMTAVAKITIEQLRGNDFLSRKEAGQYVRRHWRPVVFTPLALLASLALLFGSGLLVGLIGKIPWVGDVAAGLSFVPLFLGGLLFLFLALVFAVSFWLTPAIVASTGDDTFETSFELFSTLSGQPWRLILYQFLLRVLTFSGAAVFAAFAAAAVKLVYIALYLPMGYKFAVAFEAAWRVMPSFYRGAYPGLCPPLVWVSESGVAAWLAPAAGGTLPLPWPQAIAATLLSLGLLVILGIVAAYSLNVNTVGQTIIYTILRKRKDDESLLEMYDDELEQAMITLERERQAAPPAAEGAAEAEPETDEGGN
ncbi:MAG: hypothetical protein JSU81_11335 [Candidatus Coatesbacteria bacterium]|nr:MAG: hypothetical protein JSU81_11335 [Candidatus Coatesbacteria bacterium]